MPRVLYVTGTSFCGSTLTSFLLNAHPEMASVGEVTGPDLKGRMAAEDYRCSCDERMAECEFWADVVTQVRAKGMAFSLADFRTEFRAGRALLGKLGTRSLRHNALDALRDTVRDALPAVREPWREIGRRNVLVIDAILRRSGAAVFVDASKDPMRARYLDRTPGIDVRVLHLIRHPAGFVCSDMTNGGRPLRTAVATWKRTGSCADRIRRSLRPEQWLQVRYEDLCRDPDGTLQKIAAHAGVSPVSGPRDFTSVPHHIIGNRMRLKSRLAIALDERWRQDLAPEQIREIQDHAGRMAQRLGYAF